MEISNTPLPSPEEEKLSFDRFREEVLKDYRLACESREVSLAGRREVLTGKAKFGIFGDGKEVAQIAMAKFFRPGDFHSGYYRDQTFMFATDVATTEQFFAQLYAHPDIQHDPFSAGRQMNNHFATPFVNEAGEWLNLTSRMNIASDISPTASQMTRSLGLAFASSRFRKVKELQPFTHLSHQGNEVSFVTIGDASTSEGHFWETINAAGVLQVPLAVFIWDDGYGISVPKKYQTTKSSISKVLKGFEKGEDSNGIDIYRVKGWDYAEMCQVFEEGIRKVREQHIPAVFHVEEITQPQGHSTSGSHERYKSPERLEWEKQWDCIRQMKEWIISNALASAEELEEIENLAKTHTRQAREQAWNSFLSPIKAQVAQAAELISGLAAQLPDHAVELKKIADELSALREPARRDVMVAIHSSLQLAGSSEAAFWLKDLYQLLQRENRQKYSSQLLNEGPRSAMKVEELKPVFTGESPNINGFEILNRYFDQLFSQRPEVFAFGEDVGHIGDVNQGFAGLQEKYGRERIFDTGIRELTIIGQGMGMAMRGLRPIAEIQYLDYLLYALQPLSDEVATLHYRSAGQQSCPLIVRTRGHRLEGIWHSGSPMGMVVNALRGIHICVPRNMTQAVGMYNTLLKSNDPGLVVECLNGYRLKEKMPANIMEIQVALGIPETLREGEDITLVSYGSTLRIVLEAAETLALSGIQCEVIDVQTLLPFDIHHHIVESVKKTGRIIFIDEDVPGGATAFMFTEVMEKQNAYRWLDAKPRTLSAKAHRPAYGSDGDYFSKPNLEEILDLVRETVAE